MKRTFRITGSFSMLDMVKLNNLKLSLEPKKFVYSWDERDPKPRKKKGAKCTCT